MSDGAAAPAAAPVAMTDDAAATSAAAVAAPIPLHHTMLPSGQPLHCVYLRGISSAQLTALKAQAARSAKPEFALIRGDMLVGVFQLECAAVKSSLQALRGKLKTRDLHTELLFNLGHTAHHDTAIRQMSAAAPKDASATVDVVVCILHANDEKLAFFQTSLAPHHAHVTPISQLRQHCNTAVITKTYKIGPSELQVAFAHLADQDPLLLAVIGRITTKI